MRQTGGCGIDRCWSGSGEIFPVDMSYQRVSSCNAEVPFNRVRTPASGAPSARMRRGLVMSMVLVDFTWSGFVDEGKRFKRRETVSSMSHVIDFDQAMACISCIHSPHSIKSNISARIAL